MGKDAFLLVFITASSHAEAQSISRALVEESLAACVNIVPGVRSVYRWEGKLNEDDEVLMLVKTSKETFARLEERVTELHSYDVPEIIGVDLARASEAYLAFIRRHVDPDSRQ